MAPRSPVKVRDPLGVHIGPFPYTIEFNSKELALRDRDNNETTYGRTFHEELLILIADGMAPIFEKEVVVHEIQHCVAYLANISDETMKLMDEEMFVRITSPIWLGIIRSPENIPLFEYLNS